MSSSLSIPSLSATALLAALALCFPAPSQAQDELFDEDFEGRTFCTWSASTSGATDCVSCVGKPDGTQCADTLLTSCGGCPFVGPCDEEVDRECDCITYACSAGACVATSGTCIETCSRNTDGNICSAFGCGPGQIQNLCCNNGACSMPCGVCSSPIATAVDELLFAPARCEGPADGGQLFTPGGRIADLR